MQLHLKSEELAWSGIMMTISVVLIILAAVIETSSLFLLAASSFICGLVQRKFSIKVSIIFIIGAFILGIILAPNKLYCFTFMGFSIYVLVAEYYREKINKLYKKNLSDKIIKRNYIISWIIKGAVYHFLFMTAIICMKKILGLDILDFISKLKSIINIPVLLIFIFIIAIELLWIIFDKAYVFFQERYGLLIMRN